MTTRWIHPSDYHSLLDAMPREMTNAERIEELMSEHPQLTRADVLRRFREWCESRERKEAA